MAKTEKKDDVIEYLSDGQMEVLGQLEDAKKIAGTFFGTETPTPEMVFGIYDRVFDAFDDAEEEDEDDDK